MYSSVLRRKGSKSVHGTFCTSEPWVWTGFSYGLRRNNSELGQVVVQEKSNKGLDVLTVHGGLSQLLVSLMTVCFAFGV